MFFEILNIQREETVFSIVFLRGISQNFKNSETRNGVFDRVSQNFENFNHVFGVNGVENVSLLKKRT